ncbi:MAG: tetratricopeptide repeat protein [Anaerolineae bacterium]|nr:tetratricopeptide repeat protein [Anaerolineae bacterium]
MTDFKTTLQKLNNNLNTLREREAKYGGDVPVALLNQIADHETAIAFTKQVINGDITEAEWRKELSPLLIAINQRTDEAAVNITINIHEAPEPSPGPPNTPGWRWLVSAGVIVALIAGLVAIVNDALGIRSQLFPLPTHAPTLTATITPTPGRTPVPTPTPTITPTPLAFAPATINETLIVIATFHETGATKTEPHVKIRRAIKDAAAELGLDTLRVEIEPTELAADQREEAETLGNRYKASMVIWGEDSGVEIFVNFLDLTQPDLEDFEIEIRESQRTQIINPSSYTEFILTDLPGQITFLALSSVGKSFYLDGQYEKAVEVIKRGMATLAEDACPQGLADAYFRLGWINQEYIGDYDAAIDAYTRAIELNYQPLTWPYNNRGNAFRGQGNYETAIADYNQALAEDPTNILAYDNRGFAYYKQGDYEAAIAEFNKAIELDASYASAYNDRGLALRAQGEYDAAIADFGKAIKLGYKPLKWVYDNRGFTFYKKGDYDAAIADYTQAIELDPAYVTAYNDRAFVYYKLGDYEAAMADHNRAIELDPAYAPAYNDRGLTFRAQGDIKAAIADFSRAIELGYSPLAWVYDNRGFTFYKKGDYEAAIADYTRAIELDPTFAVAYNDRGLAYYEQGDYDSAIADYTQAIELDHAALAWPYNNRGNAHFEQGNYEAAIADYTQAIELDHDPLTWPYNSRGNAYRELGNYEAAIADYAQVIEIDPAYTFAYFNRGLTYAEMGQIEQAKVDLEQGRELEQSDSYPDWVTEELAELGVQIAPENNP